MLADGLELLLKKDIEYQYDMDTSLLTANFINSSDRLPSSRFLSSRLRAALQVAIDEEGAPRTSETRDHLLRGAKCGPPSWHKAVEQFFAG
jgi:hypothetical protein